MQAEVGSWSTMHLTDPLPMASWWIKVGQFSKFVTRLYLGAGLGRNKNAGHCSQLVLQKWEIKVCVSCPITFLIREDPAEINIFSEFYWRHHFYKHFIHEKKQLSDFRAINECIFLEFWISTSVACHFRFKFCRFYYCIAHSLTIIQITLKEG